MKSKYKLLFCLSIFLFLMSCSKDFLDTPKNGFISDETYFSNEENVEQAVIACYKGVVRWNYETNLVFMGDLRTNDVYKGGWGEDDNSAVRDMCNFSVNATNTEIQLFWTACYLGIFRCEEIRSNIDKAYYTDEANRKKHLAEAQFIRASLYFDLTKAFGGVPIINGRVDLSQKTSRSTAEECKNMIYSELEAAIPNLPLESQISSTWKGRATRGAAQAMLARAALFFRDYEKARDASLEVIKSNQYSLNPDFGMIFRKEGDFSSESVFEVAHKTSPGPWPDANLGSVMPTYMMGRNNGGWGFYCPRKEFVASFDPGDPRLIHTIMSHGDTLVGYQRQKYDIQDYSTYYNPDQYQCRKFYLALPDRSGDTFDKPWHWKKIRYAEVLLTYAEALLMTGGDKNEVAKYINEVRTRAINSSKKDSQAISKVIKLSNTPMPLVDASADLLTAIKNERRWELAGEGFRFWDLVRWGDAATLLGPFGFKKGLHEILPIPQAEIDLAGLEQNLGY